jgi:hypothetical protein
MEGRYPDACGTWPDRKVPGVRRRFVASPSPAPGGRGVKIASPWRGQDPRGYFDDSRTLRMRRSMALAGRREGDVSSGSAHRIKLTLQPVCGGGVDRDRRHQIQDRPEHQQRRCVPQAARPLHRTRPQGRRRTAAAAAAGADCGQPGRSADIRAWTKELGIALSERGRVSARHRPAASSHDRTVTSA